MKLLKDAVVSLTLVLAAGVAAAGTVSFAEARQDATGKYSQTYTLDLASASLFGGWFKTTADEFQDALKLDKVTLSRAGQSFVFDLLQDGTAFTSVKPLKTTTTDPDFGVDFTTWETTYTLSPVLLSAGLWDVKLDLIQSGEKVYTAVSGGGNLSNAVPEPQSLALAALALMGVAFTRRGHRGAGSPRL